MADDIEISLSIVSRKTNKNFNQFWVGFVIYTAAFAVSTTESVNYIICQIFQLAGLFLIVPASINLIQFKIENQYLKIIYTLYCCWSFTIIVRGFLLDYNFFKKMLFDVEQGMFLYFVPLILLFPQNLLYYKKIFHVVIALGVLYLIYDILFLKLLINPYNGNTSKYIIEYFTKTLSISSGFLLLTYIYHSNKRIFFCFFIMLLTILFAVIRARRGLIFMTFSILTFSYIIFFYQSKVKFFVTLIFFFLTTVILNYRYNFFNENKNRIFNLLNERGLEDTRTGVDIYFYKDMKTEDWILGRGIRGSYYEPDITEDENTTINGYRFMIETNYLNIILKGGIISLGLLLLIAIPSIFKGLFYSNNILSKASAIWVLLWIIFLYPATVTTFTLHYLLVWISIGVCYSKTIRGLSDDVIKRYFSINLL